MVLNMHRVSLLRHQLVFVYHVKYLSNMFYLTDRILKGSTQRSIGVGRIFPFRKDTMESPRNRH